MKCKAFTESKTNSIMSKTNKIIMPLLAMVVGLSIVSCVQDDDFSIPSSLGNEENAALQNLLNSGATVLTIEQVKNQFVEDVATQIVSDVYVKGYITSSDATGNFYKEFYMQDSPSNPTAAIKVVLDQVDSYNKFNLGREIYINLKDLYIGETRSGDGVIAIGDHSDDLTEIEALNEYQIQTLILRSNITEVITPLPITLAGISDSNIGMFVMIENAEFPSGLSDETYVDATDSFDTQRTLQACEGFSYSNFILETSTFANFKNEPLPTLGGTLAAVVTKTYNGSDLVLALNTTNDVNMTDTRCVLLDINDFTVIFEEDFESMPTYTTIASNGWTAYAESGGYNWRALPTNDNGNPGSIIASMGAYNSGDQSNITWLITPAIDFDAQTNELANFQSSNSFSDNSELEFLISTDWDGTEVNIVTATWTPLSATIVADSEYYQNWVDSGSVDLSAYTGTGYVAFKYTGGDNSSNEDGTYEIDNFKILGL